MFNKLKSLGGDIKKLAAEAKDKAMETAHDYQLSEHVARAKELAADAKDKALSVTSEYQVAQKFDEAKRVAVETSAATLAKAGDIAQTAKVALNDFDYSQLKNKDFYSSNYEKYKDLSAEALESQFRSTFEMDKSTEDMVNDIRLRLPTPARQIDDIFEQCKKAAIQRAIATFTLGSVMQEMDNESGKRYAKLSQNYGEFKAENNLHDHKNFAAMKDGRYEAREQWLLLEDGYDSKNALNPYDTDIEHVIPKKEIYDNLLLRSALSDDGLIDVINHESNLIYADSSLNGSKSDSDLIAYLDSRGVPDISDPDLLHIEIQGQDVTVRRSDAVERYETAKKSYASAQIEALKTLGAGAVDAGVRFAAQQVVGLILVETIDIFIDEIKDFSVSGNVFSTDGLADRINSSKNRITERLKDRFEERQLIARAKSLGLESGVSGALSAIPQILISLMTKLPSFMLAIIREGTLSVVRSVRVLMSNEPKKFEHIQVVLAGTASAVCSVYVSNAISKGIMTVPMLNLFNRQVSDVLTGVVVTAVPLAAIYTFDQNKSKLLFAFGGAAAPVNQCS